MLIDLTDLDIQKTKEFLDYFYAALRKRTGMPFFPSGSSNFDESGYVANLDDSLPTTDGGRVAITWKITFSPEGSALSIEAITPSEIPNNLWELSASQFVSDILLSVVSGKKQRFFGRRHFSAIAGSNLPGEYWLPGYRFAPQFPENDSRLINSERYLVIDQEVEAIDLMHANELADQRAAIASAHLSLITDVGISSPIHEYRWFISRDDDGLKQYRESTQHIDLNIPARMPSKGELCKPVRFEGSIFEHERYANSEFRCPIETRKVLRGYLDSDFRIQSAFTQCSLLYQLALTIGRYHPTVRISYQCASIDAIVQESGKEYRGFSDFVKNNIDEDVEELLEVIHSQIRSAHFHGGQFALGETDHRRDFLTHPQKHLRFHLLHEAHRVLRSAILNWVMREMVDDST